MATMLEQSLEILIDELMNDDELRLAFLRSPCRTLQAGSEWAMPLTDNERRALCTCRYPVWERVTDALRSPDGLTA